MTTAPELIDLDDLVPIPDGANLVHIAESTMRGHLSSGRLTRYYVGRRVLVSRAELARFVQVGTRSVATASEICASDAGVAIGALGAQR